MSPAEQSNGDEAQQKQQHEKQCGKLWMVHYALLYHALRTNRLTSYG